MDATVGVADFADWHTTLKSVGERQYAGIVRRFLSRHREPRSMTSVDLANYVLTLRGERSRSGAITAIGSFFQFLHDEHRIAVNPARKLSKLVKSLDTERSLFDLVRNICGEDQTRKLLWRDVALILIGSKSDASCLHKLGEPERTKLLSLAQRRIGRGSLDSIQTLCLERVFESDQTKH
jgi:hypothetical protein